MLVAVAAGAVAGADCVVVAADALAFDTFSGVADAAVLAAAVVGFLAVAAAVVVVLVDSQKHSEEDPLHSKQLRFHSLFFSFPPLQCWQWLGRSALP